MEMHAMQQYKSVLPKHNICQLILVDVAGLMASDLCVAPCCVQLTVKLTIC